ncbi:MAG: hypothetical protein WA322_20950, partial [Pseudolabrys sp.]
PLNKATNEHARIGDASLARLLLACYLILWRWQKAKPANNLKRLHRLLFQCVELEPQTLSE